MSDKVYFENAYFIIGTAYAGKSTMVKELAKRHGGIAVKRIAPENHTLVMLADPMISVRRFFERPDPEKQFLYRLILEEPDPEYAMQNYRKGLELINSKETYDEFLNSGFTTILRDENRTIDETVALAEKAFGL